jgi:cytochrome c oxidase subunit II
LRRSRGVLLADPIELRGHERMMPDVLAPAGEGARRIADLAWFLFAAGTIVFVAVMAALALAVRRGRDAQKDARDRGRRLQLIFGGAVPAVIVVVLFVVMLRAMPALGTRVSSTQSDVELIGRQWWWEARYPRLGIVSANEIHIPVGRPVRLTVRTADVIHSFWVPRLHGKIDLVPGRVNTLRIDATRAGTYRGQCAEYCGLQHARMGLRVVAHEPASYAAWADRERATATPPGDSAAAAGMIVFDRVCAACHAVRGTLAAGARGPDLTHVASRATLAAGTLANTHANLTTWVAEADRIKPGNGMPSIRLAPTELAAVVAYLQSLR